MTATISNALPTGPLPQEQAPADSTGIIDMETFQQIRDMDDDEDEEDEDADPHEFSKGIVWGFFEQADTTFQQMEDAL
jgi:osomolarity two-component system phosphorelay intermediate protein YPD1